MISYRRADILKRLPKKVQPMDLVCEEVKVKVPGKRSFLAMVLNQDTDGNYTVEDSDGNEFVVKLDQITPPSNPSPAHVGQSVKMSAYLNSDWERVDFVGDPHVGKIVYFNQDEYGYYYNVEVDGKEYSTRYEWFEII